MESIEKRFSLSGRRAVVTGAATGVGAGIVERLCAAGCTVAATDVDLRRLKARYDSRGEDSRVLVYQMDVSSWDSVVSAGKEIVERMGGIDILVNNAGIFPKGELLEMDYAEWRRVLDVNLDGVFRCCRVFGPPVREQAANGRIVNISSAEIVRPSRVGFGHYEASKCGLEGLTRSLALELAPHGVTVNSIAPAGIETESFQRIVAHTPELRERIIEGIPLGRLGAPDDVGDAVVFLCSRAGAYITGATLLIDGGYLLVSASR